VNEKFFLWLQLQKYDQVVRKAVSEQKEERAEEVNTYYGLLLKITTDCSFPDFIRQSVPKLHNPFC